MKTQLVDKHLTRRFNDIGVYPSDLPEDGWRLFFTKRAVLSIEWIEKDNCTEKVVRLLKEWPDNLKSDKLV